MKLIKHERVNGPDISDVQPTTNSQLQSTRQLNQSRRIDFSIDAILGNMTSIDSNLSTTTPITKGAIDLSCTGSSVTNGTNQASAYSQQSNIIGTTRTYTTNSNNSMSTTTTTTSLTTSNKKPRPKKYQCPYCWVALSNTGQFRGHIRIHTGERPFKCDQPFCEKTFTRNEELTRHKRIHTGQRPYACQLCNKRFGRKDHLKKHTRTHERHSQKLSVTVTDYSDSASSGTDDAAQSLSSSSTSSAALLASPLGCDEKLTHVNINNNSSTSECTTFERRACTAAMSPLLHSICVLCNLHLEQQQQP